jgi:O-antigen/teichoic acid export membrane protein
MIAAFRKLASSPILQAGALLTATSVLTGVVAYAFQVAMGRMLTPSDFTVLNATLALSALICSPIGAPTAVVSRQVAMIAVKGGGIAVRSLYQRWSQWLWAGSAAVVLIVAVAGLPIQNALRLPDLTILWLLTGMVVVNIVSMLAGTFLHGLQAFGWLALVPIVAVVSKIAICVFLVTVCGWGLHGALGGVVASMVIACCGLLMAVEQMWCDTAPAKPVAVPWAFRLVLPIAVAGIGLTTMTQIDLVLVNRYFEPSVASQYAPAAVLGKAVLYLPAGLVTAILPIVAASDARRERSIGHLAQALAATALLCSGAALFYFITGPRLVSMLYGDKYGQAGSLLAIYGVAMVPMALAMVMQGFLFARGKALYCWAIAILAIAELLVIHAWHPSLVAVVGTVAAFNTVLAVIGGILIVPAFRNAAGSPTKG